LTPHCDENVDELIFLRNTYKVTVRMASELCSVLNSLCDLSIIINARLKALSENSNTVVELKLEKE